MVSTKITDGHSMQLPILLEIWQRSEHDVDLFLANTEGTGWWLACDDYEDAKAKLEQVIEILGNAEHALQEMGWDLS